VSACLEVGAVNAAALRTTNLVHQRELERTVAVGSRIEARRIDVVAEADGEIFVVETGAQDQRVHQFAIIEAVGHTCPRAQLESLVEAAAVAEQEFERSTGIHLERRALDEGHDAGQDACFFRDHKFAARVEGEFAVKRNVFVFERLVGAVEVAESAAKIEVGVFAEHAEPQGACRQIHEQEVRISDVLTRQIRVVLAIAVVLAGPLEVGAVDAALAHTEVGAQHEVVRFFAVATHFLGIRAGKAGLKRGKLGSAGFVTPQRAAYSEVVVAAYWQFLIVRCRIGVVSVAFQNGSPLVAVIGYNAVVAVHYTGKGGIEIERAHVKL